MAASRASSRRATWRFWTRSVVRVNRTRAPLSIRARPMAAARWLFPPPGGPKRSKLAPLANQLSPAVMAITCALESIGTASKSKLSSVFPGGRRASARWRSIRLRPRSASSCSAMAARKRAAGHPSLSACSATCDHTSLMAGRRNSLSRRLMRAVSTAWVVFMPPLPVAGADKILVGVERNEVDDDVRHARRIGREVGADGGHVGQPPGLQIGGEKIGEFGLTAAVVGQGEPDEHDAAGLLVGQPLQEGVEGSSIGLAGEELIPIDEVEERHRLAAERVDHMPIVDDLIVLAACMCSPAGQRHQVRA